MVEVLIQPVASIYVITEVPLATPVTIPEEVPTVALALLLLQVPPPASESVIVEPTQT